MRFSEATIYSLSSGLDMTGTQIVITGGCFYFTAASVGFGQAVLQLKYGTETQKNRWKCLLVNCSLKLTALAKSSCSYGSAVEAYITPHFWMVMIKLIYDWSSIISKGIVMQFSFNSPTHHFCHHFPLSPKQAYTVCMGQSWCEG